MANNETLIERVKKLSADQLDAELASHEHNDIGRHIILQEKIRRAIAQAARPHWLVWASFGVAVIAAIFAGISSMPEIRNWLATRATAQSNDSGEKPNYGPPPTDNCFRAIEEHWARNLSPYLDFKFEEPKQASVDNPEKPGEKIHGWLVEAHWNFKPPRKAIFQEPRSFWCVQTKSF